jgi:hypothetical protein
MKQQKPEGLKLTSVIVNTIILASMIIALTSGMKLI